MYLELSVNGGHVTERRLQALMTSIRIVATRAYGHFCIYEEPISGGAATEELGK